MRDRARGPAVSGKAQPLWPRMPRIYRCERHRPGQPALTRRPGVEGPIALPSADAAMHFTSVFPSVIAGKTGRHTYTEWDQVLIGAGAAHPAMNPYLMAANAPCRKSYSMDMCATSLEILNRTVMVPTNPEHSQAQISDIIHNIAIAARVALGGMRLDEAELRSVPELDVQKFDAMSRDLAEERAGH